MNCLVNEHGPVLWSNPRVSWGWGWTGSSVGPCFGVVLDDLLCAVVFSWDFFLFKIRHESLSSKFLFENHQITRRVVGVALTFQFAAMVDAPVGLGRVNSSVVLEVPH